MLQQDRPAAAGVAFAKVEQVVLVRGVDLLGFTMVDGVVWMEIGVELEERVPRLQKQHCVDFSECVECFGGDLSKPT